MPMKRIVYALMLTVLVAVSCAPTLEREMDRLLSSRELIKVKLQEGSLLDPKEAANDAAETLGAEFVQAIGRRFVLYRQAEDPEKRTIVLPR